MPNTGHTKGHFGADVRRGFEHTPHQVSLAEDQEERKTATEARQVQVGLYCGVLWTALLFLLVHFRFQ